MIIIAKCSVQLGGHIYNKGEACEYGGPVTQRIADNFKGEDGSALVASGEGAKQEDSVTKEMARKAAIEKTAEVMGKEGIRLALDGLGVNYNAKWGADKLAEALLVAKGEIEA